MFSAFSIPISWTELIKRTIREASADNVLGLAAQLAYYFLLALVPAIVFLVALTSYFPAGVIDGMMRSAAGVMPADMLGLLQEQMDSLRGGEDGGILSFGLLMALWSSSAALVAVTDALNRAYDIEEGRPWWKVRLTAIGLTVALAVFVLAAFTLVVAGPDDRRVASRRASGWVTSSPCLERSSSGRWRFVLVDVAVGLVYYLAPDAEQDWVWITPGAILATILWLLVSLAFKYYVTNFAQLQRDLRSRWAASSC